MTRARQTPAVASGRSVMESPPRSSKLYISFITTSEVSPEGAGEHAGVLEDGRGPFVEAVAGGDAAGGVHHVLMAALVLADQVVGAAGGLQFGHGRFRQCWGYMEVGKLACRRLSASSVRRGHYISDVCAPTCWERVSCSASSAASLTPSQA